MWPRIEIVLWSNPDLHGQDSSSSAHGQQWLISSSGAIHLQTPFTNRQLKFHPEDTWEVEAARSLRNTTRRSLVCFSLQSHDKGWSTKKARRTNATASSRKTSVSKAQQRPAKSSRQPLLEHCQLSSGLYLCPFQTSYVFSSICSNKIPHTLSQKHHVLVLSKTCSHMPASAKHLLTSLLQQNDFHVCFSKNILS